MKKYLIAILLFSGIAFSQVAEEEHLAAKVLLADYAIQLNRIMEINADMAESMNALVVDLQAIKEPSEELITILKKYKLYKEE